VLVRDAPLPAIVAAPRELAVDPDPESGWVTDGVVLEADVGIENVAELVTSVEGDEEVAVPEREIARHRELLVRGRAPGRGEEALGVRDHARDVPPFDEIRADEWSADPETDHAGGEVLRNVLQVDIPRRDEREVDQRPPYVTDVIGSADRGNRKDLDEVGAAVRGLHHSARGHR